MLFKVFGNLKFKNNINEGGSGIGLSFCKKLASLVKATINFKSIKGVGSTFSLTIFNLEYCENKQIRKTIIH